MNKNKSSLKRYFLLLLVLLTIYSSWSLFVSKNFALHSDSGTEIRFEIEDYSTLENIITILKNKGRISHVWSFEFMAKIKRYDNNIQSGIVTLKGDYTNNELINQLRILHTDKLSHFTDTRKCKVNREYDNYFRRFNRI